MLKRLAFARPHAQPLSSTVDPKLTAGKRLVMFDELHGSGATVAHIVEILKKTGLAKAVYVLTLTTK